MKKFIGFIIIVMIVLIGLFACDTENSGSSSSEDSSSSSSQEPPIIQYTVVFDANGGSGTMANQTFIYDESQDLNNCSFTPPTGHQFGGWNTAANGQGDTFADGATVKNIAEANGSVTLYAQWISGNGSITVVTPTYQDIPNLLTYSDNTFTTLSGYETYSWYIDRTKQSNSTSTLTPDTSSLSAGSHTVTVMVTDSQGGAYSAEMTFQVKKSY